MENESQASKLLELDNLIMDMEDTIGKVQAATNALMGLYFDVSECNFVACNHKSAGVLNQIALDYIVRLSELLETARALINGVRNKGEGANERAD